MKSDLSKKLVLHTETLRALKVKTAIKAGAYTGLNSERCPTKNPKYC